MNQKCVQVAGEITTFWGIFVDFYLLAHFFWVRAMNLGASRRGCEKAERTGETCKDLSRKWIKSSKPKIRQQFSGTKKSVSEPQISCCRCWDFQDNNILTADSWTGCTVRHILESQGCLIFFLEEKIDSYIWKSYRDEGEEKREKAARREIYL